MLNMSIIDNAIYAAHKPVKHVWCTGVAEVYAPFERQPFVKLSGKGRTINAEFRTGASYSVTCREITNIIREYV